MKLYDLKEKAKKILDFLSEKFLHHFPENKRKPILFGFAGLLLLLIVLIPLSIHSLRAEKAVPQNGAVAFSIQSDEFFISSEPDFLPEFLLERQSRGSWSLQDIRPFWKVPGNTALWTEQIKSAVDKLMEGIP